MHVTNFGGAGRVLRHMTKRILLLLTIATGLLAAAGPADARPTEELFGNYNFLLEATDRPTMLQHGDFATFRAH
jgi:hypothetical protein